MMLDGLTPRSSTLRISLLLAQSKPVPSAARVCSNIGSSLHFTAVTIKAKLIVNFLKGFSYHKMVLFQAAGHATTAQANTH